MVRMDPMNATHPSMTIERVERAVETLFAAYRRLRGREQQRGDELSGAQLRALDSLYDSAAEATTGATARQLADFADVTPATMTGMLDVLEAKGIIRRERGLADRRTVNIVLTDRGREVVTAARARWRERWDNALGDIPAEDLQATVRTLAKIAQIFDDM